MQEAVGRTRFDTAREECKVTITLLKFYFVLTSFFLKKNGQQRSNHGRLMFFLGLSEKLHAKRDYVDIWNKQLGESAASGGVHSLFSL